jgi:hypothetical protein
MNTLAITGIIVFGAAIFTIFLFYMDRKSHTQEDLGGEK